MPKAIRTCFETGKAGLVRVADDLEAIFTHLGNHVVSTIWGEGVWQKGEVLDTKAMDEAYQAGLGTI